MTQNSTKVAKRKKKENQFQSFGRGCIIDTEGVVHPRSQGLFPTLPLGNEDGSSADFRSPFRS